MEGALKDALEIVAAQARIRYMTEDEIVSMTRSLALKLSQILGEGAAGSAQNQESSIDFAKHRREKTITCLECGKSFKLLTKRHLVKHGLTPSEYREKFGLPKKTSLVSKGLQRERRKRMKEMELWKKRTPAESKK